MSKRFVVIGGGPVGILSSILLSKKGYEVTLIEAGDMNDEAMLGAQHYLFESPAKFPDGVHKLGGGSNFWHGRVSQFSKRAMTSIEGKSSVWPFSVEDYEKAHAELLKFLNLPHVEAIHEARKPICCSFCDTLIESVPYLFSTPHLLKDLLLRSENRHGVNILFRAYANSIQCNSREGEVQVEILSDAPSNPKVISADKVVVSAGCLQSTALIYRSFPIYFEKYFAGTHLLEHFDGYVGRLKISNKSSKSCLSNYRLDSDRRIPGENFGLGISTKSSSSLSWHLEVSPNVRHYGFDPRVNRFNIPNRKLLGICFLIERLLSYPFNRFTVFAERLLGISSYSLWLKGEELPYERSALGFEDNSPAIVQKIVYKHKVSSTTSLTIKRELRKFGRLIRKNRFGKLKLDWWARIPFYFSTGANWHPMGTLRLGFPHKGPLDDSFQLGLHRNVMVLDSSSFPIGGHHNPTAMSLSVVWLMLNKLPDASDRES
jgi:hypothetical protein